MSVIQIGTRAEIYPDSPELGDWMVWSLDKSGDGGIYCIIFAGPNARDRAVEYAEAKYVEFRLHDPNQRPYQSRQHSAARRGLLPNRDTSRHRVA